MVRSTFLTQNFWCLLGAGANQNPSYIYLHIRRAGRTFCHGRVCREQEMHDHMQRILLITLKDTSLDKSEMLDTAVVVFAFAFFRPGDRAGE